jgi:hypothetical protein
MLPYEFFHAIFGKDKSDVTSPLSTWGLKKKKIKTP